MEAASDALKRVVGPSADMLGKALALPLVLRQEKREEQARKVVEGAAGMLDGAGHQARAVPGRILWPIIESASLEEDTELQKRWAALLANAASTNPELEVLPVFAEILRQLNPMDVKVLEYMAKFPGKSPLRDFRIRPTGEASNPFPFSELYATFQLSDPRAGLVDMNLRRLGLIEIYQQKGAGVMHRWPHEQAGPASGGSFQIVLQASGDRIITALGFALVKACDPPRTEEARKSGYVFGDGSPISPSPNVEERPRKNL